MKLHFFNPLALRHIEAYSEERVDWLYKKVISEGIWTTPLALDNQYNLVLDGQHRMEVALRMRLKKVPVILFDYSHIPLRSLRDEFRFDWETVTDKALEGNIYPYKTVKHDFIEPLLSCTIPLKELGYVR